jgi:preprotein translocase subunit SecE
VKSQAAVKKQGNRLFKFFGDVIAELRKVTWPSREEAFRLTGIVIAFTVVVAIILGVVDYGFSKLMSLILLR